ncbi:MAG: hypothetical protein LBD23_08360, partial [Oscillospiraceae bacterium]|nr:hypothetical protein [Oscillospiraceae bacterium]
CTASDFDRDGFIFNEANENPGRRPFPRGQRHFEMLTMGNSVIISVTPNILPYVMEQLKGKCRILIYYGVGAKKFLGCFEVISPPELTGQLEKWPWEIKTKNLLPEYSDNWEKSEYTFSRVKREFPDSEKDMDKIKCRWGAIPISDEFGKYLVGIIEG